MRSAGKREEQRKPTSPDKVNAAMMAPPQHLDQARPLVDLAGGVVWVGDEDCTDGVSSSSRSICSCVQLLRQVLVLRQMHGHRLDVVLDLQMGSQACHTTIYKLLNRTGRMQGGPWPCARLIHEH